MNTRIVFLLVGLGGLLTFPASVLAQGAPADPAAIASQNLMGYTHMFIAYAIAWALVLGWIVSISRRLGRLEKDLAK